MINTILFIAVIVLMLVLLALFVIILMEFRAKKSYDHYVMQNLDEKSDEATETVRSTLTKESRSIPEPEQKKSHQKESESKESSRKIEENEAASKVFTRIAPTPTLQREDEASRAKNILQKSYKPFTHQRLVETMGLSSEEADEFVLELIHQLEDAIAELDRRVEEGDFEEIEHITHGLKGAALNIGSGGVADILVDYNHEMKESKSHEVAEAYQELLRRAVSDLKIEYSQVA